MPLRRLLLSLTLLASGLPVQAGLMQYGANEHQSQWQVEGDRLYCRLSHEIPIYGTAIFERRAGGDLGFRLEVLRQPREVAMARLVSAPPQWKHETMTRDLGQVDIRVERAALHLREPEARRLLLELENGMFPTFSFSDWADGRDEIEVALSAVRVRAALGEFLQCLDDQLPYGFDDVRHSNVLFEFDKSELTPTARRRLDAVAEYMLLDEEVALVLLEGRADIRGWPGYNDALSERRVASVRDYLAQQGITDERFRIETRAYGERRPLASNRTEEGRAQNRSVVVTLQGG